MVDLSIGYVSLSEANQLENAIGRLFDIDGDGMISEDDLKSVIPDASCHDTLWLCQNSYWKWIIYRWFTCYKWWFFHSYVSLPEGNDMAKVGKMEKKTPRSGFAEATKRDIWKTQVGNGGNLKDKIGCR